MVNKNYSKKRRGGGDVKISDIEEAIVLTENLSKKLKKIENDLHEDAYGMESNDDVYGLEDKKEETKNNDFNLDDYHKEIEEPSKDNSDTNEYMDLNLKIPEKKNDYSFRNKKYQSCKEKGCSSYSYSDIIQKLKEKGRDSVVEKLELAENEYQVKDIIKSENITMNNKGIFGGKTKRHRKYSKKSKKSKRSKRY